MIELRQEIYNENGLIEVRFIEVDAPTNEELIAQKETELLTMYKELESLKGK